VRKYIPIFIDHYDTMPASPFMPVGKVFDEWIDADKYVKQVLDNDALKYNLDYRVHAARRMLYAVVIDKPDGTYDFERTGHIFQIDL